MSVGSGRVVGDGADQRARNGELAVASALIRTLAGDARGAR
jgi:hypothetical protein